MFQMNVDLDSGTGCIPKVLDGDGSLGEFWRKSRHFLSYRVTNMDFFQILDFLIHRLAFGFLTVS
jgi:hypothetical protein